MPVLEIQRALGFIEKQQPRIDRERPRQDAELLLPLAQMKVILFLPPCKTCPGQSLAGFFFHLGGRVFQKPQPRIKAHQHHIQDGNIDGDAAPLRNIAAQPGKFPGRLFFQELLLQHTASPVGQNPAQGF